MKYLVGNLKNKMGLKEFYQYQKELVTVNKNNINLKNNYMFGKPFSLAFQILIL